MTNMIEHSNVIESEWTDGTFVPEVESSESTHTPYECAKIVNAQIKSEGFDKILPPQMFYTYTSKGMIDGVKGKHNINSVDLMKWYEKYMNKNLRSN